MILVLYDDMFFHLNLCVFNSKVQYPEVSAAASLSATLSQTNVSTGFYSPASAASLYPQPAASVNYTPYSSINQFQPSPSLPQLQTSSSPHVNFTPPTASNPVYQVSGHGLHQGQGHMVGRDQGFAGGYNCRQQLFPNQQ